MRLATAADEILPLRDQRVQNNEAYLTIIILSRVVTHLGNLELVTPNTIEGLFAADLSYLQALYNEVNSFDGNGTTASCPECHHHFTLDPMSLGGSSATPSTPS
jgi:hypothetical protein